MAIFKEYSVKVHNFPLTEWQEPICYEVIYRVLMRKRHTIVVAACRQVGKTESLCCLLSIIGKFFVHIYGERFKTCITAPDRGTGSEVYDRTKLLIEHAAMDSPKDFQLDTKNLDKISMKNGCTIENFGLFKGYASREGKKSTKEGRTYNLIIRDEMHIGEDSIYKDELEPAMATTGGVDVFIGNGGYRDCMAKKLIDTGTTDTCSVFKLPYAYMKEAVKREYAKTGNEMWMRWFDSQEKYIDENGWESDVVQKNLNLKWIVTRGNFFDWFKFRTFSRQNDDKFKDTRGNWLPRKVEAGIDWGKENDETWVVVSNYDCDIEDMAIFKGDYEDQVAEIKDWLLTLAKKRRWRITGINCDSTSSQDVIVKMLRKAMRGIPVRAIIFNLKNKDSLAKKALRVVRGKVDNQTVSYPANHPLTKKFENQNRRLQKEHTASGMLKFFHPNENDAHDDACDGWFLSLWKIVAINQVRVLNKKTIG